MSDKTAAGVLFGKRKHIEPTKEEPPKAPNPTGNLIASPPPGVAGQPIEVLGNVLDPNFVPPPDMPPELLAAVKAMLQGGPPPPQLMDALAPMLSGMFGGAPDPVALKKAERRDLAKAMLLSLAQAGKDDPAILAVRETDLLLHLLDREEK